MARVLTPLDGCAIMTAIVRQATGQANLASVDVSNFVSAGETVLATGKENTMNALSIVLEDMGGGGAYAAPLAHDIFAYLVEHLQNVG